MTRWFRIATAAVCAWAAVAITLNQRWTVSHTIDRTSRVHPAAPYVVWAALGAIGLRHAHDMATNRSNTK